MTSKKLAVFALLSTYLLVPCIAGAVGLGEMSVISSLGNRLRVEIPLLSPSSSISVGCFQLTTDTPNAIADVPWLTEAQITMLSTPPRLLISTRHQIVDPVIQLAIFSGCGTFMTRHYTALLSPSSGSASNKQAAEAKIINLPSTKQTSRERVALPGETAGDMARRLFPRSPLAQQRFVRRLVALNPDWLSAESTEEVLPEGVDLHYPPPPTPVVRRAVVAPPAQPDKDVAVADAKKIDNAEGGDRLLISPTEPLPSEPTASQATPVEINSRLSAVNLKVATMRAELDALQTNYPAPPPAISTALVEMETRLLAVELSIARISLANLAADKAASDATAAPEPQVTAVSLEVTSPEPSLSPVLLTESDQVLPETAPRIPETGLILLGIFGLGVTLSVVLYRRTRLDTDEQIPEQTLRSLSMSKPRVEAKSAEHTPQQVMEDDATIQPDLSAIEDPVELGQLELADILLAYGRTQGAIELLLSMIEANPADKESLQPSMRLLEIYQQADMRQEFELLAEQLSHRFNIECANWDESLFAASEASTELDVEHQHPELIENMPEHIKTRVTNQWGTRECLGFLQKLLSDNRDGTRKGFPVSVTYTILGLIKTMEAALKTPTHSHNM